MKLSHFQAILMSALLWLAVGLWLLTFGLGLIGTSLQLAILESQPGPFLKLIANMSGGADRAGVMLVAGALLIGYLKSRFIFTKTVRRVTGRICSTPSPLGISQVYSKGYLILIGSMMLLGMSLKWVSIPLDIRGFVDVAIGSALINGSMLFVRSALQSRKTAKS